MKDSFVSFFPNCPESEAREQLPDAFENWVVKGDRIPVRNCVPDTAPVSIRAFHCLGSPIPNLLTIVALIEKMFQGFLFLLTQGAH
jgi:hypothetical protein